MFTNIKVGCGYNGTEFEHYAFYAEITATDIKIYYVESGTPLQETLTHGLTLDGKTDITIVTDNYSSYQRHSYIILTNSKGNVYKHELLCWFGNGNAFIKNDSSVSIDAEIRLFPRSITKPIWLFGDSYFSFWNESRWPYYLFENNFKNCLFNHLSGQSPTEGFEDLQNLLSLGYAPQILVWCHGMNGNGDTYVDSQYVIDTTKKEIIDWLVDFCAKNKIVLVLATIPTALIGSGPLLHKGYNNYVRSLGVRYIDFADAVGAQPDGTWAEGLCADGVHPTIAGAKVLFARAIADCPELTIS